MNVVKMVKNAVLDVKETFVLRSLWQIDRILYQEYFFAFQGQPRGSIKEKLRYWRMKTSAR